MSKTPFPEFSEADTQGNTVSSDIFADYDATIINFWNNGCGTCIEEMPQLEELYHQFRERNINLIGVGTDSGTDEEQLETARNILKEKGVTYVNLSPDPEGGILSGVYLQGVHLPHHLHRRQRGQHHRCAYCWKCAKADRYSKRAAGIDLPLK